MTCEPEPCDMCRSYSEYCREWCSKIGKEPQKTGYKAVLYPRNHLIIFRHDESVYDSLLLDEFVDSRPTAWEQK